MKNKELIENNSYTTTALKKWYLKKLTLSLDKEEISEQFKEMIIKEGLALETLDDIIEFNPTQLSDFFDKMGIFTCVYPVVEEENTKFKANFIDSSEFTLYKSRLEANVALIKEAYVVLNTLHGIEVDLN
jgi:hypothetical protein